MELRQYARTFWKWLWLIVLGAVIAGAVTYVVSSRSTPIYRASAQMLIQQGNSPTGQQWTDVLTSERLAANYARLLTTRPVLDAVAERVGLPEITSKIIVDPVRETQIIVLHVEDPNPAVAVAVAKALPLEFIEQNEAQQQRLFDASLGTFDEQIAAVEADIEDAQYQLQEYERRENDGEILSEIDRARRASLEISLAQYRGSLADMLRSRDAIKRDAALTGDTILVVEPAVEPTAPVRPRVMINTLLAVALAFLLMVALAFLIEYLDDTIKLPEDATRVTNLPALGSLVQHRADGNGRRLITHANPTSPLSEGYRTLRTNIQFSSLDRPADKLLVTSASPGEGKSTTIANLAVVMAQSGKQTVLVDTDLRKPVLHQIFGVPNAIGVTSALLQPVGTDLKPYLQATEIENLWLLTSGPQPPNPSELLGSKRMSELVEELQDYGDIFLFDSPPVLAVTDAAVLSHDMDGVLLVIESAKTRETAARRAAEELRKVNANVLGVAVNRLSSRLAGSNFYYYDYYEDRSEDDGTTGGKGKKRRGWRRSASGQDSSQPQPAGGFIPSRSTTQDA